jgi:hypothetical protein
VNGGYFLATNLIAGQGVWVRNISGKPAYLVFPSAAVTKPTGPSFQLGRAARGGRHAAGASVGDHGRELSGFGLRLLGPEWLLFALFLRRRTRRKLPA